MKHEGAHHRWMARGLGSDKRICLCPTRDAAVEAM